MNDIKKHPWPTGSISSDTLETFELGHRMILHAQYLLQSVIPDDVYTTDLVEAIANAKQDLELQHEENLYESTQVLTELFNLLCPEEYYFSAHPDDGACFGYWEVELEALLGE